MSKKLSSEALRDLLETRYDQYNRPSFIESDPIAVPHRFTRKEDIEIAGFLTALIAWGRRDLILRSANALLQNMDDAPHQFVMGATAADLKRIAVFVHRTMNGTDMQAILRALRKVYGEGGLEAAFAAMRDESDTKGAIVRGRTALLCVPRFPERTQKHLADPSAGSSAKRLNMFLRWMVRRDGRGVDFGLWNILRPHQLICPLDVHTGNVARKLGLLNRNANDWTSALQLTAELRKFDATDPVRFDFSLFGLGIFEKF